ncbi:MAG: three-Cys-motif partner protein TcmP, partial [Actinomycetota bacterium]|nr:three-Cys-motif partner protein TcmP [Actinomycetota bacterium]
HHTAAKHRIYDLSLRRWFPILLSRNGYPVATYAEGGFAGLGSARLARKGPRSLLIQALPETRQSVTHPLQSRVGQGVQQERDLVVVAEDRQAELDLVHHVRRPQVDDRCAYAWAMIADGDYSSA